MECPECGEEAVGHKGKPGFHGIGIFYAGTNYHCPHCLWKDDEKDEGCSDTRDLKLKMDKLFRIISEKTSFLSFTVYDQPQLLELINIGEDAVPLLLEHLVEERIANQAEYVGYDFHDYAPMYALTALRVITGTNPIKPEHRGNLSKMADDWLDWRRKLKRGTWSLTETASRRNNEEE